MIKDKDGQIVPISEFVEKLEKELRSHMKHTRKLSKGMSSLAPDSKMKEEQASAGALELRKNTDRLLEVSRTTLKVAKELAIENQKLEKRTQDQSRLTLRLQE